MSFLAAAVESAAPAAAELEPRAPQPGSQSGARRGLDARKRRNARRFCKLDMRIQEVRVSLREPPGSGKGMRGYGAVQLTRRIARSKPRGPDGPGPSTRASNESVP